MADIQEEVCVFCTKGEEAGSLRNTSDEDILAHYNCLLFSPGVITRPQKDSQDNTAEFDIPSVISEINRGKKLNCSYCNKKGATVGCNNRWCRKTYHYLCVTKAKGIRIRDEDKELYIAYCYKHARKDQFAKDAQLNNGAETSGTFIPPGCSNKARKNKTPNKRKKGMEHKTARKKLRYDSMPNPGTVRKAENRHDSDNRTNGDNMEVPGPSRTCLLHIDFYIRSDSGSDVEASDSNGSNSAQIGAEQNPGMRTEPERMHTLSDHTYHEQMKALEPSTTLPKQEHPTIVIGSDTETEDELPVFTNTKEGEGTSTKDDTPVTNTSSRLLQETLPSPARGRTSSISTDSSGPCTPEIFRSLSLSGFPKKNRKRKRKRNNPELETALLNMPHEERDVYSQLYDEVGGSLDISTYNDCDVEQIKDASNETVEDIPEDQHTGTKACSDGNNLKFAALESSVSTRTPGQFASSTPVHDATSVSQLPRYSPGVTNSPSRQFTNITNIALVPTVNSHSSDVPVDQTETIHKRQSQSVAHLSPITTGTEMLIGQTSCFSLASNKCTGMSASPPRAKDAFLLKELLIKGASTSREVPPTSAGINGGKATEVQNAACNSSPLHIKALSHLPRHSPGVTSSPSGQFINIASKVKNTDKEPLSSPSVSKTSNVQPMNPQFTSKESEEQCKQSPGFSKLSDEQSTRNVLTTKALVHTGNSLESDVPVDLTVTVLKRQSQSVAHLSAITTGTDLLIGQTSISSLVNNKCTEMSASSPRAKEAFPKKKSLNKEAPTSREEVLPTPPGIKASEVQNATCHPSPLHIKTFSDQLKRGFFCKTFKNITVQFPSSAKSVVTSLSKLESKEGGATSEQTSENCIVSQQTQKYLSSVDGDLRNSGQTADEPASPDKPPKDECMLVEEITHADDDTVLLYVDAGQTLDKPASPSSHQENGCKLVEEIKHADEVTDLFYGQTADEPASPGKPPEDGPMLVKGITHADEDTLLPYGQTSVKSASLSDLEENGPMLVTHMDEETALLSGQTSDKPASPGDLEENECMYVEEITHTDEDPVVHSDTTNVAVLIAKSSQTETSSGFPTNVDKPMNLSIDQKIKLIESYKEAEKQMSRTGDTTKAAQAFWDLCRENRCQEFLLTLAMCYMKSVLHKIVHEEPKDRDFEQAFAFLQASGCFADFTNGIEDIQAKNNSRTTSRETCNESDSDSAGSCTEVKDQGEITRDEDPDGMGSESCESSQMSNKVGQCTRDEDHNKVETEWFKTSLLSVNSNVKESSRDEDHNGMQSELCQSSLESNRKKESCRGEGHDDIQSELYESCSESSRKEEPCRGEDHDDIQNELSESSLESNRKEEPCRGEDHDDIQNELSESSLERNRKEERCRGEDHDDIQNELSESSLESNRKEEHCRGEDHDIQSELSESLSETNRKEESSRCEDHDIIQSELCKSCSQSSRKSESCIGEGYDDIQSELCESSSERSRKKQSTEGDDLDRMEVESPASSLFSPSASSKSDLVLPENASRRRRSLEEIRLETMKTNLRLLKVQLQNVQYQQQQQLEDGDAGFATNLIQFLRRVPEDKKLSTQMSILNVFSSVLGQQPMSISNPDCVPQQYTNPSSPRLGGQTS